MNMNFQVMVTFIKTDSIFISIYERWDEMMFKWYISQHKKIQFFHTVEQIHTSQYRKVSYKILQIIQRKFTTQRYTSSYFPNRFDWRDVINFVFLLKD